MVQSYLLFFIKLLCFFKLYFIINFNISDVFFILDNYGIGVAY
jgi:hypothetical protein